MKRDVLVSVSYCNVCFTNLLVTDDETTTVNELKAKLFPRLTAYAVANKQSIYTGERSFRLPIQDSLWYCSVDTSVQLNDLKQDLNHPKLT